MEKHYSEEGLLVKNIRTGDVQAFTCLYNRYHKYLYHFSLRFLKSPELSEEVVHDVFLKVWEHRERLNSDLSLKGYLIRICKNHILNVLSRASREEAVMLEIVRAGSLDHNETENAIFLADFEKQAFNVIDHLPPQRQKVFRMYRFDEMDQDEIALQMGISKGTVKDHLLKANRFIRKYIQTYIGFPVDLSILLLLFSY